MPSASQLEKRVDHSKVARATDASRGIEELREAVQIAKQNRTVWATRIINHAVQVAGIYCVRLTMCEAHLSLILG